MDEDPEARWKAAWALREITGENFGQDVEKCQKWLEEHKA